VAQLLTCPNRHHWDLTDDPFAVLPQTRGLCPLCGEPPTADSPVDWDRDYAAGVLGAAVALAAVAVFFLSGFVVSSQGGNPGPWPCCGASLFLGVGGCVGGLVALRRRRGAVKAAADALGFAFFPSVSRVRAEAFGLPPFLLRPRFLVDRGCCMEGRFQDSRVLLLDAAFRTPPDRALTGQTVVFFPDPVPSLPDFQLEPGGDESKLRNRSPGQFFGLRPLNPFRDEPFGRTYRLGSGIPEAVRPWLSPGLCAFLERNKGWTLGAWQGRFYLYRRGNRCRGDACATFIAVAWRLRDFLMPDPEPPAEVAPPART
jgi:hypothetical protein